MPRAFSTASTAGLTARTTETGWRLVGRAASLVGESAPLAVGSAEECIYAVRLRVRPWLGSDDALTRTLTVLSRAIVDELPDAPPLTIEQPTSVSPARFSGFSWDFIGERQAFAGELLWRHSHPVERGIACTTHVLLEEAPQLLTLTVRVYADGGPERLSSLASVGQARPAFLSALAQECRLQAAWGEVAPNILHADDIAGFVKHELLGDRAWPVAVLSALENGQHVISPEQLADEWLGLARVFAMDTHPTSYRLTDAVGDKLLSCFFGALRVYLPQFSCADSSFDHPLLMRDSVADPVERAELAGNLALGLREVVPHPPTLSARRLAAQRAAGASTPTRSTPVVATPAISTPGGAASPSEVVTVVAPSMVLANQAELTEALQAMVAEVRGLAHAVTSLTITNRELLDEVQRLRTSNAVRQSALSSIERRLERLDQFVRVGQPAPGTETATTPTHSDGTAAPEPSSDAAPAEDAAERLSLVDVVRHAAEVHQDTLLMLESAERAAADSPYEDVDRVAFVLDAMAQIARRRRHGTLGMPVRQAFREYGIEYRSGVSEGTPERQRMQYVYRDMRGREYECHEHIALGGGTYDPRWVLRIYFTSREPMDPRFVIGHVGRHHQVLSTT